MTNLYKRMLAEPDDGVKYLEQIWMDTLNPDDSS